MKTQGIVNLEAFVIRIKMKSRNQCPLRTNQRIKVMPKSTDQKY